MLKTNVEPQMAHTTSVTIAGECLQLSTNAREDGSLGEIFIQWGRNETAGGGLVGTYAAALSLGLQHEVPLVDLLRQGLGLRFVPAGRTDDPEIPWAYSIPDYIARRLAIDWLPHHQRAKFPWTGAVPRPRDSLET
jgi:hypothetical protein